MSASSSAEDRPFLDSPRASSSGDGDVDEMRSQEPAPELERRTWAQRNQWIVYALASGACAAFNGVFAKL
jgi:tRNA wybutosine-synthesizing protein 1